MKRPSKKDLKFQEKFFELIWGEGTDVEERLATLREAVDLADQHGDVHAATLARMELLKVTEFSGRYDESLVIFTGVLGVCRKQPEIYTDFSHDILWAFKWIAGSVTGYHTISRKQVEDTLKQMEHYYTQAGLSHRAIFDQRAGNAGRFGDIADVSRYRELWLAAPKDGSEDCRACEDDTLATLYLDTGEPEKALQASQGLIQGRLTCGMQPQENFSSLLLPLFRLKKYDLADELQRKSLRKVRGKTEHLAAMGEHVAFLALTDQLTRAISLLEIAMKEFPTVRRHYDRLEFLKSSRVLFQRLAGVNRKTVKLRLTPAFGGFRPDNAYPVADLLQWAETEANELAKAFDKRNGNTYVSSKVREHDDLLSKVHPIKHKSG